ncbi:MAG TPA: SGNH/GDSL hydrolase family protein [Balneolales bacterium]|nr:SGNH/GDSL hydrolase family protein [Balneolales bacterium]
MAENKLTKEERKEVLKYLIQFLNLEKRFPLLPGVKDLKSVASFIGLPVEELKEIREEFDDNVKKAAIELLKEDEIVERVQNLPFDEDETVLVLGDSITDDLQSWFEIFKHLLQIALPDRDLHFINAAIVDDTTFSALQRFDRDVITQKPDWIIVALGSHDAMRKNFAANRTIVSLTEFWENLNTISLAIEDITNNPPIWITPPPAIKEIMDETPEFNSILEEKDLVQFRDVISGKKGFIVDPLGTRMGQPPEAWNYLNDGFHPSLSGHINTVKSLLVALTNKHEHKHGHDHDHD